MITFKIYVCPILFISQMYLPGGFSSTKILTRTNLVIFPGLFGNFTEQLGELSIQVISYYIFLSTLLLPPVSCIIV